jgi:hypothetical protein
LIQSLWVLPEEGKQKLEAKRKGKSVWWQWLDRMEDYYQEKFGQDWKKKDKDF